jgi:hypothetical protein
MEEVTAYKTVLWNVFRGSENGSQESRYARVTTRDVAIYSSPRNPLCSAYPLPKPQAPCRIHACQERSDNVRHSATRRCKALARHRDAASPAEPLSVERCRAITQKMWLWTQAACQSKPAPLFAVTVKAKDAIKHTWASSECTATQYSPCHHRSNCRHSMPPGLM